MTVQELIEKAARCGLTIHVEGDWIEVRAPQEPKGEARALIEELRRHKEELLRALTQEDRQEAERLAQELAQGPKAGPPCWNCGAQMTEVTDIHGHEWWTCWECARSA